MGEGKGRRRKGEGREEDGKEEGEAAVSAQFNIQIREGKNHFFFSPGVPLRPLLKCLLKKFWDELQAKSAVAELGRAGGSEK